MGITVPPDPLIVVTPDGVRHAVGTLVLPANGSSVTGSTCVLLDTGEGGSGGGQPSIQYSVLVTSPTYDARVDVAPLDVMVEVIPAPPAGAIVVARLDDRDVGSAAVAAGRATVVVPTQVVGSYTLVARMLYQGAASYSNPTPITVEAVQPTISFISPTNDSDVAVEEIDVAVLVGHPTADPADLTVQLSLTSAFSTVVAAVYDPGTPSDPQTYVFRGHLTIPNQANHWLAARVYDQSPGRVPTVATARVCSLPAYLDFTHSGQTFAPRIELWSQTSILWTFEDNTTSNSLNPVKDFGSAAVRVTRLVLGDFTRLRTINCGFNSSDDQGIEYLPGTYNHPNQNLVALGNPGRARNLWAFLAAHCPFVGTLDLRGFDQLVWLETFQSALYSILVDGCTSLRRVCVEQVDLSFIDLTTLAGCLYDLRCAAMQRISGSPMVIRIATMAIEYHWCVRDNPGLIVQNANGTPVNGADHFALLPAIREFWDFGCQTRSGAIRPRSPYLQSIQSYGNNYDALDVEGQFPAGRNGEILASNNPIATVNIRNCPGLVRLNLRDCELTADVVDATLVEANSWGTSVPNDANLYYIDLRGNPGPHQFAADAAAAMRLRGWTIWHENVQVTGVDSDNFNRADGMVGNGWTGVVGGASGEIASNRLQLNHAGYGVYITNPGTRPSAYRTTATVTHATTVAGYFGLVMSWIDGAGLRVLWASRTDPPTVGNAATWAGSNVTVTVTGGYPASWTLDQDHTIAVERNGTAVTIYVDGQEYGTATFTTNATRTATGAGFCGEGGGVHVYDDFAVTT